LHLYGTLVSLLYLLLLSFQIRPLLYLTLRHPGAVCVRHVLMGADLYIPFLMFSIRVLVPWDGASSYSLVPRRCGVKDTLRCNYVIVPLLWLMRSR